MPELDQMSPEMEPQQTPQVVGQEPNEHDEEGAMAKADLYKLANYSFKLFKKLDDNDQLEAWVQAKITKAADYIASVYHYLEYEMEFSEYGQKLDNSDVMNESQKLAFKNKLVEAKEKIKALKIKQAQKVSEGHILGGDERTCEACGGSGHVMAPERQVPEEVKAKIEKYNRKAKAMHAASKRIDKNKNGIPDALEGEKAVGEDFDSLKKSGDTAKTHKGGTVTKTDKGIKHSPDSSRFTDEPHTEPKSIAKSRSASEKAGDKSADKEETKKSKDWSKRFGKDSVTKVSAGKKVDPSAPKEKEVDETQGGHSFGQGVYEAKGKKPDFLDMDKDGNKKEPMKKAIKDKKVDEALKGKQKKLDQDKDGDIEADDLAALRAKKKSKAAVKEAIAEAKKKAEGKKPDFLDMDKDGDKEEPMKKAVADKEVVKESAELDRMKQFLTRLNG